ncbi:hypothetical protein DFH06DRAFT_958070, partial [Mycena polygramma]
EWQLNRKLGLQLVPEWDGHGKTAIAYLCKMAELVRLSPQMIVDLGAIAPLKFTGRAEGWWTTQTITVRNYVSQSWDLLLKAIQAHFLNEQWLQDRQNEFEEMRFRQRGHENEWPLDFLQRRAWSFMFLRPDEEDGPRVVYELLRTAPSVWKGTINSEAYTSLFALFAATRRHCPTLMGNWDTALKVGSLGSYYSRRSNPQSRNAHANAADLESEQSYSAAEEAAPAPSPEDKSAYAGYRSTPRRPRPPSAKAPPARAVRPNWPEGKTVKGYDFVRRDDIRSERKPDGDCFVCTSPYHFARSCPHYGKWVTLRDANMLEAEVPFEVDEADRNAYIAMLSESSNSTESSVYLRETLKSRHRREVFTVDAGGASAHLPDRRPLETHRNARRRRFFEDRARDK